MRKKASLLSLLLVVAACQKNPTIEKDQIKKANWLIGNWQSKTDFGILSENWKKVNDSTFKAESLFIKDKDTIHKESIILQQKGERLVYTTTIQGQNDDKPINFQIKEDIDNDLVFENLKNNYPQKISYKKTNGGITAEITGLQFGKPTTEKYTLSKTK